MSEIDFPLACASCGGELQGRTLHADCPHCQRPVADTIHPDTIDAASWTVSADVSCVDCGYNLRTLPVASVCPECAQAIVASLRRLRRVWLGVRCFVDADTNHVHADVRCVECGYNLRTLHVTALCPECGRLVLDSLTARELVFSDTKWLRRVRSGVTLLVAALLGLIALFLTLLVLSQLPFGIASRIPRGVIHFLVDHAFKPFPILGAIGVWQATSPNPLKPDAGIPRLLRPIARCLGIAPSLLLVPPSMGPIWLNPVAGVLAIFAIFCSLGLTLYRVGGLALQGRRPGLRSAINVAVVVVAAGGVGLAVADARPPSAVLWCILSVVVIGILLSLITLVACRRMLSSAIRCSNELEDGSSLKSVGDAETTCSDPTPND